MYLKTKKEKEYEYEKSEEAYVGRFGVRNEQENIMWLFYIAKNTIFKKGLLFTMKHVKKMKGVRISLILTWQSHCRNLIVLPSNTKDENKTNNEYSCVENPLSEWIVHKLKYNVSKIRASHYK